MALVGTGVAGGQTAAVRDLGEEPEAGSRTVSASEQFVVHGADLRMRAAIASLAEETHESLIKEVGGREDDWENAIVLQLHGQQYDQAPARLLSTRVFPTAQGFRLQIRIHLARGKPPGLERSLLELLLVERGLRGRKSSEVEGELGISPWLLDGLREAIRWRRGDRDRELYEALFKHNQLFPVDRLLEVEDPSSMDSMARSAYRASAGALVMALLGQGGGKEAMRGLLGDAATFEGEDLALLLKHFPGMNLGEASLAKWWALQLARMSENPVTQTLNIRETEAELDRLLVVRFRDGSGELLEIPAGSFRDLLAIPAEERLAAVGPVMDTVGLLLFRAFPAHRPIMTGYLQILSELVNDKDENAEARLAMLEAEREKLRDLGARTRDYLDWYRITNADELSGAFEDYIELKESLREPVARRKGPVSSYLDDMQKAFGSNRQDP